MIYIQQYLIPQGLVTVVTLGQQVVGVYLNGRPVSYTVSWSGTVTP